MKSLKEQHESRALLQQRSDTVQRNILGHSPVDIIIHNYAFCQVRPCGCKMKLTTTAKKRHKIIHFVLFILYIYCLYCVYLITFSYLQHKLWKLKPYLSPVKTLQMPLPDWLLTGSKRKLPKLHPPHLTAKECVKICQEEKKQTIKYREYKINTTEAALQSSISVVILSVTSTIGGGHREAMTY